MKIIRRFRHEDFPTRWVITLSVHWIDSWLHIKYAYQMRIPKIEILIGRHIYNTISTVLVIHMTCRLINWTWCNLCVVRLCGGGELMERIVTMQDKNSRFSERSVAEVMKRVLEAISYCHERKIAHKWASRKIARKWANMQQTSRCRIIGLMRSRVSIIILQMVRKRVRIIITFDNIA